LAGRVRNTSFQEALHDKAKAYFNTLKVQAAYGDTDPEKIKMEIRTLADRHIGMIRNKEGLSAFLREATRLYGQVSKLKWKDPVDMIAFFDVKNLLLTGCAVASCALAREESRGHQFREDFPSKNNTKELRWILVKGEQPDKLSISSIPIPFDGYELKPPSWNGNE
jgi:succinate dehydrogenase/fumarate reductase flavoprotein subunit